MPGGCGNITPEDGKQFSKDYQPKNPGRKKKILTQIKEKGYSKEDMITAMQEIAFYQYDELSELIKDNTKPFIIRIIAKNLVKAFKESKMAVMKEILEYLLGKPEAKQNIELTDNRTEAEIIDSIKESNKIISMIENKNGV